MRTWVKHVNGINLYTDKVPMQGGYLGDTHANGRFKTFRRCDGCGHLKSPRSFGKLARKICRQCIKEVASGV